MMYTLEIDYVQGSSAGFLAFDNCSEDEIRNIKYKILKAISNDTFLHILNGGDEVILPSEVMKTAVFKIFSFEDEERNLRNF